MNIKPQALERQFAGYFTSLMATHTVGKGDGKPVIILSRKLRAIVITTNKLIVGIHHVFVVTPNIADTTGGSQYNSTHIIYKLLSL